MKKKIGMFRRYKPKTITLFSYKCF